MISVGSLIVAGVPPTQAKQFADPLAAACDRFDIRSAAQQSGLVAQCRVESSNFTRLEENLFYTTAERIKQIFPSRVLNMGQAATLVRNPQALANCVYAGRRGNGTEASGDGWRFRGRGLIQLTGRSGYSDAGTELGFDYLGHPELVAEPSHACLTAAWYWAVRKLNILAESGQWDAITRAVNGPGMLHADLRRQYSEEGMQAFA